MIVKMENVHTSLYNLFITLLFFWHPLFRQTFQPWFHFQRERNMIIWHRSGELIVSSLLVAEIGICGPKGQCHLYAVIKEGLKTKQNPTILDGSTVACLICFWSCYLFWYQCSFHLHGAVSVTTFSGIICGFYHVHCLVQVVGFHGVLSVGSTSFNVHCLVQIVGLCEVLSVGSATFTV